MTGTLRMTKDEMRAGLEAGRALVQEEWAHPDEIRFVDELVAEGVCVAGPWEYRDGFRCERRRVHGTRQEAGRDAA